MKPEIKQRWIEALRSGRYAQSQEKLRTSQGYCCLGVLCDLYIQDHEDTQWEKLDERYLIDKHGKYLPDKVIEWSGVNSSSPYSPSENTNERVFFADLNDKGYTFDQIAQIIEEQL